jgi:hypothetical protein
MHLWHVWMQVKKKLYLLQCLGLIQPVFPPKFTFLKKKKKKRTLTIQGVIIAFEVQKYMLSFQMRE